MPLSHAQRRRLSDIAYGRTTERLRVLDGRKAVLDALPLGVVTEVWASGELEPAARAALAEAARSAGVPLGEAGSDDLERATDSVTPQGVLAVVRDTATTLDAVVATRGLLLWLDGVQDPGNVGAVVRAAVAFGAAGLLVGTGTADPLGLKALRASAGLALRLPFARAAAADVARALTGAKREVWLLENGARDVFEVDRIPAGLVLVLGSEGSGPSSSARGAAKGRVGVAIRPEVESLNAAVAMGVVLSVLTRVAVGPR